MPGNTRVAGDGVISTEPVTFRQRLDWRFNALSVRAMSPSVFSNTRPSAVRIAKSVSGALARGAEKWLWLLSLLLVGCSSGIVPAGPDTYLITRSISGFSSAGAGKAQVYREASAWCARRGLVMLPVAVDTQSPVAGSHMGSAELTFRALRPGDAEIKRSNIEAPTFTQRVQMR